MADAHGIAVLILTVVALFLFTRDNIPLESSSLAILIILVAGFQLFPFEIVLENGDVATPLKPIDFFVSSSMSTATSTKSGPLKTAAKWLLSHSKLII